MLSLSESARMSTAREAAFRIDYPNSQGRRTRVIALDAHSAEVVAAVAAQDWNRARFFAYRSAQGVKGDFEQIPVDAVLEDMQGAEARLSQALEEADLVVMVASAGASAEAASVIGNACSIRRVMITGLLLKGPRDDEGELSRTLKDLRPFAPMLVVSSGEEYVQEMLTALRA